MKILLLGEYSNLHWTLAQGLRHLGHEVTVASDGSRWMDNIRDIDLARNGYGVLPTIKYIYKILKNKNKFRNYDIVQLINPIFLDLKAEKNLTFYRFLRKHNKRVFLGAYGVDYFWIKTCLDKETFRYSDYYIGDRPNLFPTREQHRKEWMVAPKKDLNLEIVDTCDGVIACLYEYYVSYLKDYPDKITYIPAPINTRELKFRQREIPEVVNFFIGIQKERSQLKGTDIIYKVLQEVHEKYPDKSSIKKAQSVPYEKYVSLMNDSEIILDQLYSYTPGMNALSAMAQGLVAVSGGEPEAYEILNEYENRPIVNVLPDENDIFNKLEKLILEKEAIPGLSVKSRQFIEQHHDYVKVAQQYLDFWTRNL